MPSQRKELRFFDRHYDRGLRWYEAFFCSDDEAHLYSAIGEVSPQYLYSEECPARIQSILPEARLVIMLRHPVDRAYSHYGFTVQRSRYRGSFEDFIASRPNALEWGFYSRYVKSYFPFFDKQQIFGLLFEEIFAGLDAPRRDIADFLGISPDRFPSDGIASKVNRSTVPSSRTLAGFAVKAGRRLRRRGLEPVVDVARRLGAQRLISRGAELPPIDPARRKELSLRYEEEFDELEACLDVDLSRWRQ